MLSGGQENKNRRKPGQKQKNGREGMPESLSTNGRLALSSYPVPPATLVPILLTFLPLDWFYTPGPFFFFFFFFTSFLFYSFLNFLLSPCIDLNFIF